MADLRLLPIAIGVAFCEAFSVAGGSAANLSASVVPNAAEIHRGVIGWERVPPKRNPCKQERTSAKNHYSKVTINFKLDCDATGSITIPSITESGSSDQWGMLTHVCFSPQPILAHGNACPTSSLDPKGLCKRARSTFWYLETKFNAILLNGDGSWHVTFDSNTFPFVFASSTLIVPGYTYGLCVLSTSGSVIQDDFANGNSVAPNGDTINLNMILTNPYLSFDFEESVDLYLESQPVGSMNRRY